MRSFFEHARRQLTSLYSTLEIDSMINQLIQSATGFSRTQLIMHKNSELSPENRQQLLRMLDRLQNSEPLQYVLGETEFLGRSFLVNESVLIPRPETEELVDLIISGNSENQCSVLDIGTGSGCIAISLASKLPNVKVEAWDISEDALTVARANAIRNNQDILFKRVDVLSNDFELNSFDVIVSNPPYVCDHESVNMHKNVLDYEPYIALFVPDGDPLRFYRRIIELATKMLRKGGKLYFEINAVYGKETADLLHENGFSEVKIIKDIFGKDRIVKGVFN
ncbi:MAG: peptide chain release factor N(5)-glutamine methyltransferase [Bacteroidales bacterium]